MAFQSLFRTTTALKIIPADTVITLATVPTVTSGRIRLYSAKQEELISFSGVSGSTITGCVRNLSLTANPATAGTGLTWVAGTSCELVIMHDQMIDPINGGTISGDLTFSGNVSMTKSLNVPVYADATARDIGIPSPTNGRIIYNTALGILQQYIAGAWASFASGSVVNADTTTAGKVELPTTPEVQSITQTGGSGAALALSPSQMGNYYSKGDGSDGDVTISVNGSLTRDMFYNNLTVNTGITLDPAGFAIYVAGTLTLTGTAKIVRNGNAGGVGGNAVTGGAVGAGGTAGAALATGTCGINLGGAAGGAGGDTSDGTAGTAGTAVAVSYATAGTNSVAGGAGGLAGTSGGGPGGTSATVTARGDLYNSFLNLAKVLALLSFQARGAYTSPSAYGALPSSGGGGGGAGHSAASNSEGGGGGGSGGNGGNIMVFANIIAGTGTIESKGGAGGAGGNGAGAGFYGGGGGGGGGGCGGIVVLVYNTGTPFTITLTGGAGGAGGGGLGVAGSAGTTGTTGQSIVINK